MPSRLHLSLAPGALALVIACGSGDRPNAEKTAEPRPAAPLSGSYRVSGTTVDRTTGAERSVSGTLIVIAEDDSYTSTFDLSTTLHLSGTPQRAELVGRGEGRVDGRHLTGTAETQLIVALVPGVDAGFGLLPRMATTRILNRSDATVADDGSVTIEIESSPAPGEDYAPTRTRLRGRRVSSVGIGGADDAP